MKIDANAIVSQNHSFVNHARMGRPTSLVTMLRSFVNRPTTTMTMFIPCKTLVVDNSKLQTTTLKQGLSKTKLRQHHYVI
jgi:hypothetical protein